MNNNHHGRFTDGFLIGALVGGAAVFLLGTKRGNKVLKVLTEEGFEGLTSLLEQFEERENGESPKPAALPPKVKKEHVTPKDEVKLEVVDEIESEELEDLGEKMEEVHHSNGVSHNGINHNATPKRFFRRK